MASNKVSSLCIFNAALAKCSLLAIIFFIVIRHCCLSISKENDDDPRS